MPPVQWHELFSFSVSPVELFIRGSVLYLFVLVIMRIFRREPGTIGIADLLMVVLIADASQNAMAGEYRTILDGLVLVMSLVFWNFAIDWLSLHSRTVERFTYPQAVPLVRNRKMNHANMRKQFITEEQLLSMIREHGVDDVSKVKAAFLEGSGHISVVAFSAEEQQTEDKHSRVPG